MTIVAEVSMPRVANTAPRRVSSTCSCSLDSMGIINGASFSFQEKRTEQFSVAAVVPVLDFGNTYYSYQIAVDRRSQEKMLLERSRQTQQAISRRRTALMRRPSIVLKRGPVRRSPTKIHTRTQLHALT